MAHDIEPETFITQGDDSSLFCGWYTITENEQFCAFKFKLPYPQDLNLSKYLQCDFDFFELTDRDGLVAFLTTMPNTYNARDAE